MPGGFDPQKALELIQNVIRHDGEFAPLHEPYFTGNENRYVKDCIDTGWVSSVGSYVDRFENDLAALHQVPFAIAVVNGTAALHMCLLLAGTQRDDEILIPTLTFVATPNAVSYIGAIPHFCDSDERSLGIDAAKLDQQLHEIAEVRDGLCYNRRTGRVIRAMVAMHCFGHPADLDAILDVATRWRITLIEDAAESVGSLYKSKPTGRHALMSAVSFNGNKIMTTGGGGCILTEDETLAKRAKHLTTTAKRPHPYEFDHDEVGYNYRMPNINAALGVAQIEQLNGFVGAKRQLAKRYQEAFDGFKGARIFQDADYATSNYWLMALILDQPDISIRNEFLEISNAGGVMTRPVWELMHHLAIYNDCPRMDLSCAENLEGRIINIPSSVKLGIDNGA